MGHAKLSPSGAEKWISCPASVLLESITPPERSSAFADEGTAAHFLASECLQNHATPASYLGKTIQIREYYSGDEICTWSDEPLAVASGDEKVRSAFLVDDEMVSNIGAFITRVKQYQGETGILFSERKLAIDHITGEEGAEGTGDVVILTDTELQVHDLKYGRGKRVEAESNKQLMFYALGALREFEQYFPAKPRVRIVIHQPRLDHYPEYECSYEELDALVEQATAAAQAVVDMETGLAQLSAYAKPGAHCSNSFCSAQANCKALAAYVTGIGGFEPLTYVGITPAELAEYYEKLPLIEAWVRAVETRVRDLLISGQEVPGHKLVEGKQGNRAWGDPEDAAKTMLIAGVSTDSVYTKIVVSPTVAQKTVPKDVWEKLQALVTRTPGKPTVAPVSDKRPALILDDLENDFEELKS